MAPLDIGRLWGVGEKTATALREYGVRTMGDLAALPVDLLERRFGKHGSTLAERARGVDADRVVGEGEAAKSVGHEHTFDVDTSDREMIERTLLAMADGVSGRLRASGVRASTVTVKIRDSSFRTITRQRTLPEPTDLTEPIYRVALELARPEVRGLRIRLLGVSASHLGEREQLGLFPSDDPRRRSAIEAADRAAPPLWRAGSDPSAVAGDRAAGTVRAGSAVVVRAAGRAWRRRGGAAVAGSSARRAGGSGSGRRRGPRGGRLRTRRTSPVVTP